MSTSSRKRLLQVLSVILIAGQLAVYGPTLHANPRGGTVASGQATIQDAGALTTITQGTDKANSSPSRPEQLTDTSAVLP